VPSADEISNKGLNLGEMNRILLQKIEKLTLYLIQKDQELKEQSAINEIQNERLTKIEKLERE
jgi:hypothetical protein